MLRDRGNIKWQGMFLPEHVKLLRQFDNTHSLIKKPSLDEQKLDQMNDLICEAMEHNSTLTFNYYYQGTTNNITGNLHYIDVYNQEIRIVVKNGEISRLKLSDVIEISKL